MTKTLDNLLSGLEGAGRRATPQRQAICAALVEQGGHPSAAEVYERVRSHFPMISQATVYNTLETLRELGLVVQLDVGSAEHARSDLQTHPHLNIVCTRCGAIADLHTDTLDALLHQAARRTGYALDQSKALVYGLCPSCQAMSDER
jgi:Fur family peroxide stress response transcriptional regulator